MLSNYFFSIPFQIFPPYVITPLFRVFVAYNFYRTIDTRSVSSSFYTLRKIVNVLVSKFHTRFLTSPRTRSCIVQSLQYLSRARSLLCLQIHSKEFPMQSLSSNRFLFLVQDPHGMNVLQFIFPPINKPGLATR